MLLTGLSMSSSILSGISIQQAINKKPIPSAQDRVVGVSRWLIQSPKPPARPWLTKVAKNIALIMVHGRRQRRSEEHTSELQSRGHLVCRLLLEKKNSPEASAHQQSLPSSTST